MKPLLAPSHDEITFEAVILCVSPDRVHVKETEQDHADDKVNDVQAHVDIDISIYEKVIMLKILILKLD